MIRNWFLPYRMLERFSYREVIAVLLIILVSLSFLPIPAILREILEQLQNDEVVFKDLFWQCSLLIIVFGLQALGTVVARHILINYTKTLVQHYRLRLIELQLGSIGTVKEESISSVQKKLFSDTELTDQFYNSLLTKILPAGAISIVVFVLMLYLNLILLLCVASLIIITFIIGRYFKKRRDRALSLYHQVLEQFNKSLFFVLRFKQLIYVQSMVEKEFSVIRNNLSTLKKQGVRMVMGFSRASNIQEFGQSTVLAITLLVAIWLKSLGKIEVEGIFVFFFVIYVLKKQLMVISNEMQTVSEGLFALQRLNALEEDLQSLVPEHAPGALTKTKVTGNLHFEEVGFQYPAAPPLFTEVTFTLLPGKINLILGANGVGKSTLLYLLLGYLKPSQGKILIEGIDSRSLDLNDFRSQIGVVMQETELFDGSIRDNLLYGVSASDKQIEMVLQTTSLHNWIDQLPLGLDTPLSDLEGSISGGQKQRIVLSRALLKNPRLLIMDEPTNHLDAEFIRSLCHLLQRLKGNMTILLISHNKALEEIADQKIRLYEQQIVVSN